MEVIRLGMIPCLPLVVIVNLVNLGRMSRLVPWLSPRGTEQKKKNPLGKGKNEKKYEKNEKQKTSAVHYLV